MPKHVVIASEFGTPEFEFCASKCVSLVMDLRPSPIHNHCAIDNSVLKKLTDWQVGYEQSPVDFDVEDESQLSVVVDRVEHERRHTLLVTQKPISVARACQSKNIVCASRNLYLVDSGCRYAQYSQSDFSTNSPISW